MDGRHVGLDFYDLLIEVLYRMRSAFDKIIRVRQFSPNLGPIGSGKPGQTTP